MKRYLKISDCIILSDSKKIKNDQQSETINTTRRLSQEMFKRGMMLGSSQPAIYTKLWRLEKFGFKWEPREVIDDVLKVLDVSKDELIKES